jgi:methionyl-tRNA formyltransferase
MAEREQFDLLIGSEIGRWILGVVDPADVSTVVTHDDGIAEMAADRGTRVARAFPPDRPARFALSAHWPTVLTSEELAAYEIAWNVHPGLLPWGRGYGPVFWALWAGEPAGCTLHVMSAALDRGPIVDQRVVAARPDDTGWTLYRRVLEAREQLFLEWWPRLVAGERPEGTPQDEGGSYHARVDFLKMRDEPDLAGMSAADLVRLTRALVMPGMPGPMVGDGLRLQISPDGSSV